VRLKKTAAGRAESRQFCQASKMQFNRECVYISQGTFTNQPVGFFLKVLLSLVNNNLNFFAQPGNCRIETASPGPVPAGKLQKRTDSDKW
jgi:hypothetical protein